jgi:DNA-binding CsgD family transcriptional regulator
MAATAPSPPVLLLDGAIPDAGPDLPSGWKARRDFELPTSPWDLSARRWVLVGPIDDAEQAGAAIEALTRGVGLAVAVRVTGDLRHRTLEDLHRLGAVQTAAPLTVRPAGLLDEEQRRLLAALAAGATVTEAARQLHLSRRTANRRLTAIRERLGVQSTAEAITRWSRPG